MRLVFFGSSQLSCLVLDGLLRSGHTVAAVVTQPDQPAGRKMELRATPVGEAALLAGLEVFKPEKLRRNAQLQSLLSAARLDAIAVASYGKLIPQWLLDMTPWPLNVHPSPLPLLRGPSPLRTALLAGWPETECCIMAMTPRIDDGPVLLRRSLVIPPEWNYAALETAAGELGGLLLADALDAAEAGTLQGRPQNDAAASLTGVHARVDTWIDWKRSAAELHNFVRAWDPDLGASTTYLHGPTVRRLKVWRAAPLADGPAPVLPPGTVVRADKAELWVQTGAGLLSLHEVQPENRQRMTAASFLAGQQLEQGMSLTMPST